jgi:hypothetical protein
MIEDSSPMIGLFEQEPLGEKTRPLEPSAGVKLTTSSYNKNIFRYIVRRSFKMALSSSYQR